VTTCHVLCITCSLLSSRGEKILSGDVQIRSRKSVLLILSIHSEKINVRCFQHIALIRRIHCLKHGLRLIDVNVRAGRSQEEEQGSFVDNPMRGASDFKVKDCPVCAVMKNKRPKKPIVVLIEEKRQWKPWEKVISDSSGKFRVMSLSGNRSYSVFVCARSGRKFYFAHKKKSHYPMLYLKFLARIGRFSKLLVSDQAVRFFRRPWDPDLLLKVRISTQCQKMSTPRLDQPNVPSTRLIAWLQLCSSIRTFPSVTGISLASTALYSMP